MKSIALSLVLVLSWIVCHGQTHIQKEQIGEEILAITTKYNQTWESLDMMKVSEFHSDDSFRYYRNMELSVGSNEDFKKVYPQILSGTKSFKIKTENPVVQVLDTNVAVIGFTAVAELITFDDKVLDIGTGAYTYVWQKQSIHWKIVHIHESAK